MWTAIEREFDFQCGTVDRHTGGTGFKAASMVNVVVAAVSWLAVTARDGSSGYGAISYHYEEWLWPVVAFLAVAALVGLMCLFVRGWRRYGAGLLVAAVAVGALDLAWTFVYFVSQGS